MALRSIHGTASTVADAPVQQLETLPYDELPDGEPANADHASREAATERGKFGRGNKRSVLGGRTRKGKPRMADRVALTPPAANLPTLGASSVATTGFAKRTRSREENEHDGAEPVVVEPPAQVLGALRLRWTCGPAGIWKLAVTKIYAGGTASNMTALY